jgi:hypothetical protein
VRNRWYQPAQKREREAALERQASAILRADRRQQRRRTNTPPPPKSVAPAPPEPRSKGWMKGFTELKSAMRRRVREQQSI